VPSTIWNGTIGFGLVSVPVKMISATRSRDVRFHQLDPESGSRIRYRRVAEATGEEIQNDQIVKGYEVSPGQYVLVEADELKALAPKSSRVIEIEDFVDLATIDPLFFESPYYLVPDKSAAKPYRLLVDAITDLEKVGIGRIVLRGKEHLVAIRTVDDLLCVETMRYADEVVHRADLDDLPELDEEPSERETGMARQLVEALSGEFEPGKYRDEYRSQVLELVEKKAAGEEIVAEPMLEEPAKVVDLMAALEASLARAGARKEASAPAEPPRSRASRSKAPAQPAPARKAATKKPTKAKSKSKSTGSAKNSVAAKKSAGKSAGATRKKSTAGEPVRKSA